MSAACAAALVVEDRQLTPKQTANLGVSRLGLPVPAGKLVIIQAIARALADPETAPVYEEALLEWLGSRKTESECLEALAAVAIGPSRPAFIARVRRAISHPSLASDVMLSFATGVPILVPSWSAGHSGVAPLLDLQTEERELRAGTFIPPLFIHKVEELEQATGYPFLRQWTFEFSILRERSGEANQERFSYFLKSGQSEGGHFVAHQGHWARSGYLRMLAFAVEHWEMPQAVAESYAQIALPAEPLFLKLAPGRPPDWAPGLHGRPPSENDASDPLVLDCIRLVQSDTQYRVMHLSASVYDSPLLHVELTVFSVLSVSEIADAEAAFTFHYSFLGKLTANRDGLRAFVSPDLGRNGLDLVGFTPTVLPLVGSTVGYLQSDYVARIPYVPLSSASLPQLELVPDVGGGALMSNGRVVGDFVSWYWKWRPSQPNGWPSHTACCSRLTDEALQDLVTDHGGSLHHVWKITRWTREHDYGDWSRHKQFGSIAASK